MWICQKQYLIFFKILLPSNNINEKWDYWKDANYVYLHYVYIIYQVMYD